MSYKEYFKNKKITVMGLGLLGRGLGDALFLAEMGAELIVTDLRDKATLSASLDKLKKYPTIRYTLGEHKLEDFRNRDFILKAAGVALDSPYLAEARKNGIHVEMDASLFAKLMPEGVRIIGVTGTRGKSTVTALIYEILSSATRYTLHATHSVYRGGNLVPEATLPLLAKVQPGDTIVLELDSWQLQGFGEAHISPHVSVFTNLSADHLTYYKGDMNAYFADKANIFSAQTEHDHLIIGEQVAERVKASHPKSALRVVSKKDVPSKWVLKLKGEHNLENASCAIGVARVLDIPDAVIKSAIESFGGVPGRLELVRSLNGVEIYNDTNATTPTATIAALKALGEEYRMKNIESGKEKGIILIAGGTDKGLNMQELADEIPKHCKAVVLLQETGTKKFLEVCNAKRVTQNEKDVLSLHATRYTLHNISLYEMETLESCVRKAMELAERGDTVLFSPAFASFGKWFKNEYDRGEQFVKIVGNL